MLFRGPKGVCFVNQGGVRFLHAISVRPCCTWQSCTEGHAGAMLRCQANGQQQQQQQGEGHHVPHSLAG